ncbi:MAG: hypothetical protein HKN82_15060 [Akkermansiaceae bacterium]|nr:hypothetical protein [Akkermansiaceae bacterium]NNM29865.1 hypothetical protein [Akkermansiaceae bacterium]
MKLQTIEKTNPPNNTKSDSLLFHFQQLASATDPVFIESVMTSLYPTHDKVIKGWANLSDQDDMPKLTDLAKEESFKAVDLWINSDKHVACCVDAINSAVKNGQEGPELRNVVVAIARMSKLNGNVSNLRGRITKEGFSIADMLRKLPVNLEARYVRCLFETFKPFGRGDIFKFVGNAIEGANREALLARSNDELVTAYKVLWTMVHDDFKVADKP